jgi:hypothetical protein
MSLYLTFPRMKKSLRYRLESSLLQFSCHPRAASVIMMSLTGALDSLAILAEEGAGRSASSASTINWKGFEIAICRWLGLTSFLFQHNPSLVNSWLSSRIYKLGVAKLPMILKTTAAAATAIGHNDGEFKTRDICESISCLLEHRVVSSSQMDIFFNVLFVIVRSALHRSLLSSDDNAAAGHVSLSSPLGEESIHRICSRLFGPSARSMKHNKMVFNSNAHAGMPSPSSMLNPSSISTAQTILLVAAKWPHGDEQNISNYVQVIFSGHLSTLSQYMIVKLNMIKESLSDKYSNQHSQSEESDDPSLMASSSSTSSNVLDMSLVSNESHHHQQQQASRPSSPSGARAVASRHIEETFLSAINFLRGIYFPSSQVSLDKVKSVIDASLANLVEQYGESTGSENGGLVYQRIVNRVKEMMLAPGFGGKCFVEASSSETAQQQFITPVPSAAVIQASSSSAVPGDVETGQGVTGYTPENDRLMAIEAETAAALNYELLTAAVSEYAKFINGPCSPVWEILDKVRISPVVICRIFRLLLLLTISLKINVMPLRLPHTLQQHSLQLR